MSSRSNSASPPSTVSIRRPCGVVVSAQWSASDRKAAPRSAIVARMFRRSRVERANRSSRVTSTTSPVVKVPSSPPQLLAIRSGAARPFLKYLLGSCSLELLPLSNQGLAICRDTRVAVDHAHIYDADLCNTQVAETVDAGPCCRSFDLCNGSPLTDAAGGGIDYQSPSYDRGEEDGSRPPTFLPNESVLARIVRSATPAIQCGLDSDLRLSMSGVDPKPT